MLARIGERFLGDRQLVRLLGDLGAGSLGRRIGGIRWG